MPVIFVIHVCSSNWHLRFCTHLCTVVDEIQVYWDQPRNQSTSQGLSSRIMCDSARFGIFGAENRQSEWRPLSVTCAEFLMSARLSLAVLLK